MKRPKKRTLLMLLLLLTGGAIITFAVAWALLAYAYKFAPGDQGQMELLPARDYSQRMPWHDHLPSPDHGVYAEEFFHRFGWRLLQVWVNDENGYTVGQSNLESVGWPLFTTQRSLPDNEVLRRFAWTQTIGRWPTIPDLAESRILWPGFAINTIFYAAMLWLLLAVPGFVRRRIRTRRGQCPACAYPIGTSNVCTECGAAVKS